MKMLLMATGLLSFAVPAFAADPIGGPSDPVINIVRGERVGEPAPTTERDLLIQIAASETQQLLLLGKIYNLQARAYLAALESPLPAGWSRECREGPSVARPAMPVAQPAEASKQ